MEESIRKEKGFSGPIGSNAGERHVGESRQLETQRVSFGSSGYWPTTLTRVNAPLSVPYNPW